MRKIIKLSSVLFVFIIALTSCSSGPKTALTLGNGQLGSDVYAYYLDQVLISSDKENISKEEIIKKTNELCLEYMKINTKFSESGLTIDSSVKAQLASEVTNQWAVFGNYYKSIGISKQTLTKIKESDAYKDAILLSLYTDEAKDAINEDEIKSYFKDNYVFFKAITGYFKTTGSDGKSTEKTDGEINAIKEQFNSMANELSELKTIDAVYSDYLKGNSQNSSAMLDILVLEKSSDKYPKDFFEQVHGMGADTAKVLASNVNIYLVLKFDNFDENQDFYQKYRTSCVYHIKKKDFNKKLAGWYKDSKAENNNSVQNKIYNTVMDVRSK
ncbi:MAG: hypothetical protein LBH71_03850 [Oscillospiraceae bacterium]|jgi:hypothetical protein|nr:hypothetical protein [Oscillospiraceae bacterium]